MTYQEIAHKHLKLYGKTIKTCWIADVKRQMGVRVRRAPNRIGQHITNKCPEAYKDNITMIIGGELP
jgi:hypothetical protein